MRGTAISLVALLGAWAVGCGAAPPAAAPAPAAEVSNSAETSVEPRTPRCGEDRWGDGADSVEIDEQKDLANRQYDKQQYETARTAALRVLEQVPCDIRMGRLVVSSSCVLDDAATARTHWRDLPAHDRQQLAQRCSRYGISLEP